MLVTDALEQSAERRPHAAALLHRDLTWTWRDLEVRTRAVAQHLHRRGVRPGDRVVVDGVDEAETTIFLWGVLRAGAAFVCLDPTLPAAARDELVADCEPLLVLGPGDTPLGPPSPEPCPPVDPEQPATLIYTSGSSGRPKAVVMSHRAVAAAVRSIAGYLRLEDDDCILDVLPLSFDYGLYQLFLAAVRGSAVVLDPNPTFVGELLRTLDEQAITTLPAVPSLFGQLLERPGFCAERLPRLRRFTNTGAHLPVPLVREIRRRFPAADLYLMYGLTECKRVSYLPPAEVDAHPDSVGYAMEGCEVAIVDETGRRVPRGQAGELVVRGSNLMSGYWRRPEDTLRALREGPWPGQLCLWTGDRFRQDEDGRLYCLGRRDTVFKSRGQKVAPSAVESVLEENEGVREAVVLGRPDPRGDHEVHAFVIAAGADPRALLQHCRRRLPRHQWPARIHLVDELPRNGRGKVDRAALRRRLDEPREVS